MARHENCMRVCPPAMSGKYCRHSWHASMQASRDASFGGDPHVSSTTMLAPAVVLGPPSIQTPSAPVCGATCPTCCYPLFFYLSRSLAPGGFHGNWRERNVCVLGELGSLEKKAPLNSQRTDAQYTYAWSSCLPTLRNRGDGSLTRGLVTERPTPAVKFW